MPQTFPHQESAISLLQRYRPTLMAVAACILGSVCACDGRKHTIIPGASIRFINSPDDLSGATIDRSSKPVTASSLRDIADIQAKQWESNPKLIWVVPAEQLLRLRTTKVRRGDKVVR